MLLWRHSWTAVWEIISIYLNWPKKLEKAEYFKKSQCLVLWKVQAKFFWTCWTFFSWNGENRWQFVGRALCQKPCWGVSWVPVWSYSMNGPKYFERLQLPPSSCHDLQKLNQRKFPNCFNTLDTPQRQTNAHPHQGVPSLSLTNPWSQTKEGATYRGTHLFS